MPDRTSAAHFGYFERKQDIIPALNAARIQQQSVLMFCWLMKLIFEEADPKPQALRLTVGFDNLTRPAGPATLSSAPEGRCDFLETLGVRRGRVLRFMS